MQPSRPMLLFLFLWKVGDPNLPGRDGTKLFGVGVEFIYEDPNLKPKKITIYKPKASDTVEVGRKLFGDDARAISKDHARLTFEDSKVCVFSCPIIMKVH